MPRLLAALLFLILPLVGQTPSPKLPNVVYILADDLGYGELGCYGQTKIKTPHIDRLAAEGMKFSQHYSGAPVCAPSRCVLMTGKNLAHAFIRGNKEVQPEGQWPIPADAVTVGTLMQGLGYRTGAIGKWGLGPQGSTGDPNVHGFNLFYGYNCQRQAHNYYPEWLWNNDKKELLGNRKFSPRQKFKEAPDDYSQFHGTVPDSWPDHDHRYGRARHREPHLRAAARRG